jgi:hypothetical protein
MKLFTQELVSKGYITKEELSSISLISIEDLTCSLFCWENGRYRFDSLEDVDDYTAGGVTLSSDAVTMEAMRRIDEWKRMKAVADDDTVFIRVMSNNAAERATPAPNPFSDPSGYLLTLIDGASSVAVLRSRSFFAEYRIYETLIGLWQSNRIAPIKATPTVGKPTVAQKPTPHRLVFGPFIKSLVAAHCIMLLLWTLGLLMNGIPFWKSEGRQSSALLQKTSYSENKIRAAALQFQSTRGSLPADIRQLQEAGVILPNDVSNYPLKVQNSINPATTPPKKK